MNLQVASRTRISPLCAARTAGADRNIHLIVSNHDEFPIGRTYTSDSPLNSRAAGNLSPNVNRFSLHHGFKIVLETFLRDFGPHRHDYIMR